MGGKRTRRGEYVHFSVACLILMMLASCMPMQKTTPECRSILPIRPECGRDHLATVKKLINRGDFDGALRQSQETLERSSAPPRADAALMTMGLVAAHPANPKKDYKRALGYFKQLLHDYPASGLAEEGKIWVGVLESFEKAKQVDIDIEQKKKDLGK